MKKENFFLKVITYGPLFFIPSVAILILFITIKMYNDSYYENIKNIEKDLYTIEKKSLETKINNITQIISYRKSIIKKKLELRVKDRVDRAYNTATSIYEKYKTIKSDTEIKNIIKASLDTSIWNDGESFIWIVDYNGVFGLAPKYLKHLEGTSIINFKDATGREIIKEEIAITKGKGEGFIYDTFTKPNGIKDKQYKQVAFVKAFGHYNWYLGSGEYLDTATKATNKILIETIKNIDQLGKHYVILMNTVGNVFISKSSPNLVGKNLFNLDTTNPLLETTIKILDTLKMQDNMSLLYKIINPITNKIEDKYTYFAKVPNSDWVIGSGFYVSEIESRVSKKKIYIYDIFLSKSKDMMYMTFLVMLISFLISYYVSKRIKNSFDNYQNNIEYQKNELQKINETLESKVVDRTTELETKKNELETILQEAPNPIMIHNEDGKVLMINKVWEQLTGYLHKDIDTISKWTEKAYGTKMVIVGECINELYSLNHKIDEGEYKILKKDGNTITWQFSSAPLGIIDGKRTVISSAMDITELKNKDKMLINQSRQAVMGEMIGMIAHQWRQPLSTICMISNNILVDIELDNYNPTEAKKLAKNINEQTQHLSETIDDFRNFFKSDRDIEKTNIKTVLDKTFSIVRGSLKENGIEIQISYDSQKEIGIYPRELMQVFLNIIINAKDILTANKLDNPLILIRVYEDEKYVNTEICDNAGGIDNDILPKIFDPYFSTKDERNGTGLGLYMSKLIVEEHLNGIIEVYNKNDGACFIIKLIKE